MRFGRWVPHHACKSQLQPNQSVSAFLLPAPRTAHRMITAYNATRDHAVEEWARSSDLFMQVTASASARACRRRSSDGVGDQSVPSMGATLDGSSRLRCTAADGRSLPMGAAFSGVQLLLGVLTAPSNRARRDAIRSSWALWSGRTTVVCFVVGLGGLASALVSSLADEAQQLGDLVPLASVEDRCHVSIAKAHAWWAWAARSSAPFLGRVDDDTFLHLPNLEAELSRHACHESFVYGLMANVG